MVIEFWIDSPDLHSTAPSRTDRAMSSTLQPKSPVKPRTAASTSKKSRSPDAMDVSSDEERPSQSRRKRVASEDEEHKPSKKIAQPAAKRSAAPRAAKVLTDAPSVASEAPSMGSGSKVKAGSVDVDDSVSSVADEGAEPVADSTKRSRTVIKLNPPLAYLISTTTPSPLIIATMNLREFFIRFVDLMPILLSGRGLAMTNTLEDLGIASAEENDPTRHTWMLAGLLEMVKGKESECLQFDGADELLQNAREALAPLIAKRVIPALVKDAVGKPWGFIKSLVELEESGSMKAEELLGGKRDSYRGEEATSPAGRVALLLGLVNVALRMIGKELVEGSTTHQLETSEIARERVKITQEQTSARAALNATRPPKVDPDLPLGRAESENPAKARKDRADFFRGRKAAHALVAAELKELNAAGAVTLRTLQSQYYISAKRYSTRFCSIGSAFDVNFFTLSPAPRAAYPTSFDFEEEKPLHLSFCILLQGPALTRHYLPADAPEGWVAPPQSTATTSKKNEEVWHAISEPAEMTLLANFLDQETTALTAKGDKVDGTTKANLRSLTLAIRLFADHMEHLKETKENKKRR